jgi:hypothetical protein
MPWKKRDWWNETTLLASVNGCSNLGWTGTEMAALLCAIGIFLGGDESTTASTEEKS